MGQDIPRTQPAELGWSIQPTQGLLLSEGQPKGHSLPSNIVQGLGFVEVFPYGVSSGGAPQVNFFLALISFHQ